MPPNDFGVQFNDYGGLPNDFGVTQQLRRKPPYALGGQSTNDGVPPNDNGMRSLEDVTLLAKGLCSFL